jgi:hypothetical protein
MGVVIEMCIKCPEGRTRITVTEIHACMCMCIYYIYTYIYIWVVRLVVSAVWPIAKMTQRQKRHGTRDYDYCGVLIALFFFGSTPFPLAPRLIPPFPHNPLPPLQLLYSTTQHSLVQWPPFLFPGPYRFITGRSPTTSSKSNQAQAQAARANAMVSDFRRGHKQNRRHHAQMQVV